MELSFMIKGPLLSIVMLMVVILFFLIDYGFMNRYDRERDANKGWSWDYTLFTIGMGLAVILQPWLLPGLSWIPNTLFGSILQMAGILLILASFLLHIWARQHLRQFYVERVELQKEHQIIQSGPYAYVRHPVFTTFFGIAIGLVFLNFSIVTICIMLYTFWDFTRAAKQEEELLSRTLPGYMDYIARTARFFPKIGIKS